MANRASDGLSNTVRVYQALDEDMIRLARGQDDEHRAEAEETARILLSNADLPLVFRARACMVLACSDDAGYVEWAEEAVRIANLGIQQMGGTPGPAEAELLGECERTLSKAKADYAEWLAEREVEGRDDEGEDEQAEDEESEDEGEVVYTHAGGWKIEDPAATTQDAATVTDGSAMEVDVPEVEKKTGSETKEAEKGKVKKKVRRVHSGDDDEEALWEELDEVSGTWIDRPAPTQIELDDEEMLLVVEEGESSRQGPGGTKNDDDEEMLLGVEPGERKQ